MFGTAGDRSAEQMRTFLVEPVVVVLVHGPRHAEVGELDGARRVDEAVPVMGGDVGFEVKTGRWFQFQHISTTVTVPEVTISPAGDVPVDVLELCEVAESPGDVERHRGEAAVRDLVEVLAVALVHQVASAEGMEL